jgi:small ligand-binding sensory domain FIST
MEADTVASAQAYISRLGTWRDAVDEAIDATLNGSTGSTANADLALVFASYHHREHYAELLARVGERTGAAIIAGCSGQGIIGGSQEVEAQPAVSLLLARLPGIHIEPVHITQLQVAAAQSGEGFAGLLGVSPGDVNAWLILADPFHLEVERMVELLEAGYPNRPVAGGLASSGPGAAGTPVFYNDRVRDEGAVALAIGGDWTIRTLVSQGATPIGSPWTITGAHDNILESIGGRPAYDVLSETVESLEPDLRQRAARNLLIGLAMDEYREKHARGDFLIRNLIGVERETGSLAISAYPRIGQTVQFQMRDGQAADEELVEMLQDARAELTGGAPAAAMLCSCNGRGVGLFGEPDHDARRIAEGLGPLPLAGFFCNGEIGPVGGKTFLHGFTASLAMFVPTAT